MRAFETPRLRLLPLERRDEALFLALYTDAQTMQFIAPPLSVARAQRMFGKLIAAPRPASGPFLFALIERDTDRPVGISGITGLERDAMHAEVGIMLKSEAHGRGYGQEGLAGVARNTFESFPVERVWVRCSALNPVVERMVAGVGFVPDDASDAGAGPLAQREWSIWRSSWRRADSTKQRGDQHVGDRCFS